MYYSDQRRVQVQNLRCPSPHKKDSRVSLTESASNASPDSSQFSVNKAHYSLLELAIIMTKIQSRAESRFSCIEGRPPACHHGMRDASAGYGPLAGALYSEKKLR
jgi:hypothetical protein